MGISSILAGARSSVSSVLQSEYTRSCSKGPIDSTNVVNYALSTYAAGTANASMLAVDYGRPQAHYIIDTLESGLEYLESLSAITEAIIQRGAVPTTSEQAQMVNLQTRISTLLYSDEYTGIGAVANGGSIISTAAANITLFSGISVAKILNANITAVAGGVAITHPAVIAAVNAPAVATVANVTALKPLIATLRNDITTMLSNTYSALNAADSMSKGYAAAAKSASDFGESVKTSPATLASIAANAKGDYQRASSALTATISAQLEENNDGRALMRMIQQG